MKTLPIVRGDGTVYRVRLDSIVNGLAVTRLPNGEWKVIHAASGLGINYPAAELDRSLRTARDWRAALLEITDWTQSATAIRCDKATLAALSETYGRRPRKLSSRETKAAEAAIAEASR